VGTEPTYRADLDDDGVDNPGLEQDEVPAEEAYWPTGELRLSPTQMWMEHKGWAS